MFADGYGYSEIIERLNAHGYKTKRGKMFGKNSLYEILSNEKYTGVFVFNKAAAKTINFSFCRCGLVIIPYKFYIVVITGCDVVGVNLIYKDIILSNT